MYSDLTENRSKSADTLSGNDYYVTEKGDVSRPKSAGIRKKTQPEEKSNEQETKLELLEAPSPFRIISERTPLMDLSGLLHITPEPLPPLKNIKTTQGQMAIIADQVNRMTKDMTKLQEIAEQYKCMEKYKDDVDYLVAHLKSAVVEE